MARVSFNVEGEKTRALSRKVAQTDHYAVGVVLSALAPSTKNPKRFKVSILRLEPSTVTRRGLKRRPALGDFPQSF